MTSATRTTGRRPPAIQEPNHFVTAVKQPPISDLITPPTYLGKLKMGDDNKQNLIMLKHVGITSRQHHMTPVMRAANDVVAWSEHHC